ncbi:unnamed protein product [Aspergillus oryzae]|uniref:Unnamed protein product n=1 Tax=Aspergillus oryzae var. brunneus TaxID=332754 RepID=A0ABQ6L4C9_ASPOZ|nr:unnamed protein product [Aspergillus oryzae]GMF85445.1 unnamed protein product [Aspergillus oryzae]GMG09980.1 unnamed protein product [Aspergillus oryzae]GMG52295.1 unnamed protein product [Aspergillus oryzae var. brunneus]
MAENQIPHELLAKLAGQIIQDPGIPVAAPTVSAWQEPAHPIATIQSDKLPQRTDFAIIGSGITGTSVAKTLLENELARDKTITMFEARSLTTGATSRNGGFLLSHAPPFFKRYAEALGIDAARDIALFCDRTLESIVDMAKAENLDKASQIRDVTTIASFEHQEGFAEVTESIRMYEEAIPEAKGNGFTGHLLPKLRGAIFPCRLSMTTQKPGPQWGNRPNSWLFHTKQSYDPNTTLVEQGLYWMQQNAETGDLFVGGDLQRLDDFLSSDDSVISADSARNLTDLLPKRLFKEGWTNPITNTTMTSATALHRIWSGILSMTADQVPIVGSVPTSISGRNVEGGEWIAAGFNGYGMSQCWLCGEAIARMALGEQKPEWLPDVYLSTERRLGDVSMGPEAALASFFAR